MQPEHWLFTIPLRLRSLFRRAQADQELDDELRDHLERATEQYVGKGMAPEEARRRARLDLSGLEQTKEKCRDARKLNWIRDLVQDLRYGLRMSRKSPVFTAVAVFTLALGIGANTAIFSVVDTVLLRSLPYPDSARLVSIARTTANASIPMFTYWEQNNPGFEDLCAYQPWVVMNLESGDQPELLQVTKASQNYFRLFGANPLIGRTFTETEDQPRGLAVVVLSYGLWQQRFGGDSSLLGNAITLGNLPYTVIGVLSPSFKPPNAADAWVPLQADPNSTNQAHILMVSGRLPGGMTLAQANAEMTVIGKRYVETHPQLGADENLQVTPLQQRMTKDVRAPLLVLLGAVGLVLLIACANVANLLLARATGRHKEMAVRAVIGAGRGRIARQLLTESLMLGLAGGTLGLVIGSWGVRGLLLMAPANLPRIQEMKSIAALGPWVAGFAIALAIGTGMLFGLFPAMQLSHIEPGAWLQESGARTGGDPKQRRTRGVLVGTEVAMAVALLCGAMLLIRSFAAMHSVALGFDPNNLLTMEFSLTGERYAKSSEVDRLAREFTEGAERIPGVESAALANSLPLWGSQDMIFDIPGRPPLKGFKFTDDVQWRFVSRDYFQTLRIPLSAGRLLRDPEPGKSVVINQAMAKKYWSNTNAVGQTIIIGPGLGPGFEEGPTEIVGIVGDVRERLNYDPPPTMYQTPAQIPDSAMALVNSLQSDAIMVRTRPGVAPLSVSEKVREALLNGDKLPSTKIRTMEQAELSSTERQNFNLLLLSLFAAAALLLAAIGIYGVVSYSVEQRTREIGLRAALGATRKDILQLVLRESLGITLAGVAIGVVGALALSRLLSAQLFEVTPADPLTFITVPITLCCAALVAAYVPARRAMRVDPMVALRYE
ncbi:MAG TPA: ABC transporter permease [Candidatus Acidoferrum sp.]